MQSLRATDETPPHGFKKYSQHAILIAVRYYDYDEAPLEIMTLHSDVR